MRIFKIFFAIALLSFSSFAQDWHKMSEAELKAAVPAKAPVITESIETEFRTAAGITNGKSSVFGVVIITAGYEADGKYTHFLKTNTGLRVGDLDLESGDYIFGYQRLNQQTLRVTFYKARDGKLVGAIKAEVEKAKGPIYSFLITPPTNKEGMIFIGRFSFNYTLK